jgi:hypothetical protein
MDYRPKVIFRKKPLIPYGSANVSYTCRR